MLVEKLRLEDFATSQVRVQEKRKWQKHLSDLEKPPVFPAREFFPGFFSF